MPDFWQFATVSMGLGPLQAVYQARFMKYLHDRGIADTSGRKVWVFVGDGEIDEPETLAGLGIAARERLDNLIFVVNCNLQRLDGPVRGNGKIIQEFEGIFRGAGWNVIKVIWGRRWDPLLGARRDRDARALDGRDARRRLPDATNRATARTCARTFFGKYPETRALVADWSDDEIWTLNRGGHDPYKVYAAYKAAVEHTGGPTVILAKTIKGYGMGSAGEGDEHRAPAEEAGRRAAQDVPRPVRDPDLRQGDRGRALHPPDGRQPGAEVPATSAMAALGERPGAPPQRREAARRSRRSTRSKPLLEDTGDREISTTMAFVRVLQALMRDKIDRAAHRPDRRRRVAHVRHGRDVPAGRDLLAASGSSTSPQDADQLMWYREDRAGQILQEGINEAGAISSWIAAATAYSTHGVQTIPFFIFYSMFGFQRIGDFIWAAGDMRSRGFLIGGTAGPHDAQRRGPAARGRPEPRAWRRSSRTAYRTIRPTRTRSR